MMILVMIGLWTVPAQGQEPPKPTNDRLEEFLRVYPEAEAKLDQAYSHVRMKMTYTLYYRGETPPKTLTADPPNKKVDECQMLRQDSRSLCTLKTIESNDSRSPVGTVNIFRFGPDYCAYLTQMAGKDAWVIYAYRPREDYSMASALAMLPIMGPFTVDGERITDTLKRMEPVSAMDLTVADVPLVAVDLIEKETEPDQSRFINMRLYFYPENWALAGWVATFSGPAFASYEMGSRIEYEPGPMPWRIKCVERWETRAPGIGINSFRSRVDVKEMVFEETPLEQFTLQAIGVAQPPAEFLEEGETVTVPATQPTQPPTTTPAGSGNAEQSRPDLPEQTALPTGKYDVWVAIQGVFRKHFELPLLRPTL